MPVDLISQPLLAFTEEVEDAIAERRPLVALESTLLAHGLPADRREPVARRLESLVRDEGAVPATMAIVDGRLQVGFSDETLERVIADGTKKASLRDMAPALIAGGVWATTVASTAAIAARAGVRFFATGGIGGVHRGADNTFDESADLRAVARFPVAVVCAGAKAVLDLPKTMERLETLGVPIIGYGTDELPAFYTATSGLRLRCRQDDIEVLAAIVVTQIHRLDAGGVLIVQPPPPDHAQDPAKIEALIAAALINAERASVQGAAITPFLLAALAEASNGDVVQTNIALVEANARLAARIANVADRDPDAPA